MNNVFNLQNLRLNGGKMTTLQGTIQPGIMKCLMSLERQIGGEIVLPSDWGQVNWMGTEFENAKRCDFIPNYEFKVLDQGQSEIPYPLEQVYVWTLWSTRFHQSFTFLTYNPNPTEVIPFFMVQDHNPKKCFVWENNRWINWVKKVHNGTYVVTEPYVP
jgi:hypothetical protein